MSGATLDGTKHVSTAGRALALPFTFGGMRNNNEAVRKTMKCGSMMKRVRLLSNALNLGLRPGLRQADVLCGGIGRCRPSRGSGRVAACWTVH